MTIDKASLFPFPFDEGRARDWLSDKLLSLSLRKAGKIGKNGGGPWPLLWETEVRSVIQCRGINRPLRYGNLGETLYALLEATRLLAVTANNPFSYRMNRCCVYSAFDPRLLQLSVVGLVRTCLLSHPGTAVRVQVRFTARSLQIRVSGETSFWDSDILTIVKETARLHRGSLAVSGKTAAFSMQLLEKKDSCHLGIAGAHDAVCAQPSAFQRQCWVSVSGSIPFPC